MRIAILRTEKHRWLRNPLQSLVTPLGLAGLVAVLHLPSAADDTDGGCVQAKFRDNPACGVNPGNEEQCLRIETGITYSDCDGAYNEYHCYWFTVHDVIKTFTHPGTTEAECACDTGDWEPSGSEDYDHPSAYNNDYSGGCSS